MLEREYFRQGWIFKDWRAFRNNMDAPCYVPELDDTVYTKKNFLALCNNQEEIAPVRNVGSCCWCLV